MMSHPFQWISIPAQRRALLLLLPLTWLVMFWLSWMDGSLRTREAPYGIVSFELAGNRARADAILGSWLLRGVVNAGLSLGLDYLYLVLYSTLLALCCVLLSQGTGRMLNFCGVILAWAQFVAAGLDAVENYALIQMLLGAPTEQWAGLARNCAIPKFALVALGLIFILLVGLLRLGQVVYRKDFDKVE